MTSLRSVALSGLCPVGLDSVHFGSHRYTKNSTMVESIQLVYLIIQAYTPYTVHSDVVENNLVLRTSGKLNSSNSEALHERI